MALTAVEAKQELARRARTELEKRRSTSGFKEAVIAALRAELFDKQLAVIDDTSPRISLCCSRRAGKSEVAARILAIALIQAKHNVYCVFAARTLARARQIIWSLLAKISDEYSLGWRLSEHIGQIVTPEGGVFMLLGCDDTNSIEKVRGSKYSVFFCDEASTYEQLIERLVVDCAEPGTIDLNPRGKIIVAGTPSYSKVGFWFKIATGLASGWSTHYWTLKDNPHIPNVEESLRQIREANGWDETNDTYQREYVGLWVSSADVLVYAANANRNSCQVLPNAPVGKPLEQWIREEWLVSVALDVGFTDECAVAAIGSPPGSTSVYVLETFCQAGMRADEQALKLKEFREKYKASRTVIDVGGQGKLVHGEFNQRYGKLSGGAAMPARKMNKVEAIGLFNTDLRLGRIKAFLPSAGAVFEEWSSLPWADEEKTKVHPAYKNHASDATLYAWREHRAFLAAAPAGAKTAEERDAEELAAAKEQWRKRGTR